MNSQRLSRLIMSKEVMRGNLSMLEIYECLTPSQRTELRELLKRNAKQQTNICIDSSNRNSNESSN